MICLYQNMDVATDIACEKAIKFLAKNVALAESDSRKPRLMHAMRVGMYLYDRGYTKEVIVGGFLHDTVEWEGVSTETIRDAFGEQVLSIVLANTKDRNSNNVFDDMITRCVMYGKDALIVKTADIIDSFMWYVAQNNTKELKNHCIKTAEVIFDRKPQEWRDDIYDELYKWQKSVM